MYPARRLPVALPRRALRSVALAILLLPLAANGQSADPNRAVAIAKKLELLQRYLDSPTSEKLANSDNATAKQLFERARERATTSLQAYEKGDMGIAEERMNEAFRAYTEALDTERAKRVGYGEVKKRNEELRGEIASYRQAYDEALQKKGPAAIGLLNEERLDELLLDSIELEKSGDPRTAQSRLKEAYNLAVAALTRIRQNETVVYSLDFRTPADEYRYEQNRNQSYAMLVEQMRGSSELGEKALALAKRYADQGDELRRQAETEATSGQYEAAIKTMEEANKQLVRALQMMGLSIPG